MTEQEHERPLTRRELRLREQAAAERATEATEQLDAEVSAPVEDQPGDAAAQLIEQEFDVEISPLNEDGTVRTRREIRALREAALAEFLAARAEVESDAETDVEVDAEGADEPETEFDGPPTEAFSIAELLEATQPAAPSEDADAEAVAALFADVEEDDVAEELELDDADDESAENEVADDGAEESGAEESGAEEGGAEEGGADAVVESEDFDADEAVDSEDLDDDEGDADDAGEIEPEAGDDEAAVDDEIIEIEEVDEVLDEVEDAASEGPEASEEADEGAEETAPPAGYSFPDIQPPEEWRSVFDDPTRVASPKPAGGTGDFDDLISRAVAQEGSTGGTGVSALILPSHPGDTGGLAGPLGVTGELFVTGSIELPKSIGETGGHASLMDSVDPHELFTGEPTAAMTATSDSGPTPVSALSAVSARRRPEVPVVAEPTKDKSKMPIILALSGGGLLIVIAGAVILAATQGWFS